MTKKTGINNPPRIISLMSGLRADILRNLGNLTNIGRSLHEPLWGVPRPVRQGCMRNRLL